MSASINVPRTSGEDVSASSSSSLGGGSSGSTATTTTCEDVSSTTTHSSPTTASTTGGTTAASASSTSTSSSVVVRSASGTRTRLLTRSPCAPRPVSSQNSALVAFFERRLAQIRALTVDPIVNAYTIWTENAEFVRMCKYAATTLGTVTLVLLLRRQYLLTQRRRLDALNNRDERKDNEKRPRQQRGASTGPGRPNTLRGGILVVGRDKAYEDVSIMLKKPSSSRTTTSGVPRTKRNKMQTALPEESPEDLLDEDDVLSVASTNRTAPGGGPRSGGGSAFGGKPRVSAAQDEVRETLLGTTVAEKNDEDEGTTTPSEASEQVVEETRPAARNVHSVAMVASDVSGLLAGAWTSIASSISSTAHAVKNTRATSRSSPSAADIKNKVDADSSSKRGCEESSSKTESSSSTILPIMRPKAAVSRCRSREGDPGVVQKIGLFCVQQLANAGLLVPKNVSLAAKEYVASRSAPYSLEDTIIVMKELARAFHFRCREFCEMSNSVRERLFMKRMSFCEDELRNQLLHQSGALQKLQETQREILAEYDLTDVEMQKCQEVYSYDETIGQISASFSQMLSDSIRGQLPLLSWYPPPALDEEAKLLAICSEMHATELVEVCRLTWNREQGQEPCSVEQLGDIITTARRTTETNTLKTMYDGRSIEEFYTQIGHLERSSSAFASERRKYIRIHRVRLAQLFRPVTSAPAAPAPPEPLKIAELDNKEDRAKRLAETLNNQRAVVDSEASAAREKMIAGRVLEQQKQVQQVRKI